MLWGTRWRHCIETALTWSQFKHCWYIYAFMAATCSVALAIYRSKTRLNLRNKRRFGYQVKKRWSGTLRRSHMLVKLQSKGFAFLLLVHLMYIRCTSCGQPTVSAIHDWFWQLVATAGTGVARSDTKSLESAGGILKTPEQFDSSDSLSCDSLY